MSEDAELLMCVLKNDNRFGLLMGSLPSLDIYASPVPSPPHTVQPQAAFILLVSQVLLF